MNRIALRLFLISILYATNTSYGQITLTGRVMTFDSVNVQNAIVVLRSASDTMETYRTMTDAEGKFSFLLTSVDRQPTSPNKFVLHQNYPNPFFTETFISYELQYPTDVRIDLFDVLGRHVKTIADEIQHAGASTHAWDGKNKFCEAVSEGIYFYQMRVGNEMQVKKMVFGWGSEYGNTIGGGNAHDQNTVPTPMKVFKKEKISQIIAGTYSVLIQDIESTAPRIITQQFNDVVVQKDTTLNFVVTAQFEVGKWKLIGLENSIVSAIATDPENANIIYAGTASNFSAGTRGKVYKTTDWGGTWSTLVNDVSPTVIVIDPHNRQVIYVGLGAANFTRPGILKSIDGGLTWRRTDSGIDFGVEGIGVGSLAVDPSNSNVLYAGTGGIWAGSLYKTTNAGNSWTDLGKVGSGPAVGSLRGTVTSITLDPHDTEVIYVGTTNDLLKSTDAGFTWNFTALHGDGSGTTYVVASKHQKDMVYFNSQYGFTRSDDGGKSYRIMNTGLPITTRGGITAVRVGTIIEHPTAQGNIFLAAFTDLGYQMHYSDKWGESWKMIEDISFKKSIVDMKLTMQQNYMIAGTDYGVYVLRIK